MCTMSWWRAGAHYGVLFNRDEKKTRPRAHPPTLHHHTFLAPIDPAGGGTWLAVNHHGLTVALLNRWQDQAHPPQTPKSRGLLVSELAQSPHPHALTQKLLTLDLTPYPPFTLIALDPTQELRWDWSQNHLTPSRPIPPISSSSYKSTQVLANRQKLYLQTVTHPPTPKTLETFHQESSQGPYSPRMSRPDAQTWSQSQIQVTPHLITWKYLEEFANFAKAPAAWTAQIARTNTTFLE